MDEIIKKSFLDGRLILFFGAGASKGSKNKEGRSPPLSFELAEMIAKRAGLDYSNEALGITYSAAKKVSGVDVENLLSEKFQYCMPSNEYLAISEYPWARIYTTNIDDALEVALKKNSNQKVNIKNRNDRVEDKDQVFDRLDYVYLNGNICQKDQGFVFSPEEYGKSNASSPPWYEEMAVDFFQCNFIFIGTKLDEPIFYHQIERYRQKVTSGAPRSYVITPSATNIEVESLSSYGLIHIAATLSDFVEWLRNSIPVPPRPSDIAMSKIPELRGFFDKNTNKNDQEKYIELFKNVTLVSPELLSKNAIKIDSGTIRNFYRGFKPTWKDILDGVPAKLKQFDSYFEILNNAEKLTKKAIVLIGPAGSGKSTFLKMAAVQLSSNGEKVYFIDKESKGIVDVISEIEKSNDKPFYLFFDRLDPFREDLKTLFEKNIIKHAVVVACEGKNIWFNRVAPNLSSHFQEIVRLQDIEKDDVKPILEKLRQFGPWTRLAGLPESKRFKELFEKSKRQLLIGLIETTTGIGFEQIIEREYQSIASENDRVFFILICLCTVHRSIASPEIINRSLSNLSIYDSPLNISNRLSGIVERSGDSYTARHPVYARRVLESIVDFDMIYKCLCALLDSFSVYPHPVVGNVEKSQGTLFKLLFNHRFLKDILRDNKQRILSIYSRYEKVYENDGLFWLQYGLATRSFGEQKDAYERLLTAYHAYPHDHTTHALAQQELILSEDKSLPKPNALRYLNQAIDRLKELDKTLNSDDTYPIVTMSEGHVKSLMNIEGIATARVKAKEYTDIINRRLKEIHHERLKEAHDRLFMFASTGTWKEEA